jgi:hypothetical protein
MFAIFILVVGAGLIGLSLSRAGKVLRRLHRRRELRDECSGRRMFGPADWMMVEASIPNGLYDDEEAFETSADEGI